jgi:hypothetical protein
MTMRGRGEQVLRLPPQGRIEGVFSNAASVPILAYKKSCVKAVPQM